MSRIKVTKSLPPLREKVRRSFPRGVTYFEGVNSRERAYNKKELKKYLRGSVPQFKTVKS